MWTGAPWRFLSGAILGLLVGNVLFGAEPTGDVLRPGLKRPVVPALKLIPAGQLQRGLGAFPGKECSGIVKSRQHADLYWTLNDSGDEPRLYPVHADGSNYAPPAARALGVLIVGDRNIDWEDLAVDSAGRVIIGDLGNNLNLRRDLAILVLPEPKPGVAQVGGVIRYPVRYPDQTAFPPGPQDLNFDCEAVFTVGETIHCLTKHRGDLYTTLYRLDHPVPNQPNTLTKVATIDLEGMVVGAETSPDGKRLVVLTYAGVWLFATETDSGNYFTGTVRWAPVEAQQAEAICFADDNTLKLVEELTGTVYDIPISSLHVIEK